MWTLEDRHEEAAHISVDFVLGTARTNVQGKVREALRAIEDNLLGEAMTSVHTFVSREFLDKLTDQLPRRVWIAIGAKDWATKIKYPRIRIVRFREPYLTNGVESHRIREVAAFI